MQEQALQNIPAGSTIFLATTTPKKVSDMQAIADAMGLSVTFRRLSEIVSFQSVDEKEGTYQGNALKKMEGVYRSLFNFRWDVATQLNNMGSDPEYKLAPQKVFIATEDSGFAFLNDAIRDTIDLTDMEEAIGRVKENGDPFPGAETGPCIQAAGGPARFFERVEQARARIGAPLTVRNASTMALMHWNPAEEVEHNEFEAAWDTKYPHAIHLETQEVETIFTASPRPANSPGNMDSYFFLPGEGKTLLELGATYITDHSPRRKVIQAIVEQFGIPTHNNGHRAQVLAQQDFTAAVVDGLNIGSPSSTRTYINALLAKRGISATPTPAEGEEEEALNFVEDSVMKLADAIILLPSAVPTTDEERAHKFFTFFSIVVAKQLDPRDQNKPFIIINDGSWDDVIATYKDLFEKGMIKELPGCPEDTATLNPEVMFDVVSSPDEAVAVLNDRRQTYYRTPRQNTPSDFPEIPNPGNRFKVAVFCSASSIQRQDTNLAFELGAALAEADMDIVYGAGDRYMMGAVLRAAENFNANYKGERRVDIYGASTSIIMLAETSEGKASESLTDYFDAEHIYQRMRYLIESADAFTILPGGAGTVQEYCALLYLKSVHHPSMEGKNIVILNGRNGHFWDAMLENMFGVSPSQQTGQPLAHLGVFIEESVDQTMGRLETWRSQWETAHGIQRGSQGHDDKYTGHRY